MIKSVHQAKKARLFTILITSWMLLTGSIWAQGDIDQIRTNAITAMQEGNWDAALKELDKGIAGYDKNAMNLFGAKFGWFWYHKGFCELRLKKWADAAKSFETCWTKYANKGDDAKKQGNFYEKLSIMKAADANKGAGNFKKAIELYKKFVAERDPGRDKYDIGVYEISLAYCYSKSGELGMAKTHLENAIKLRKNGRKSPTKTSIMTTFFAFSEEAIKKKDETALLGLIHANRGYLTLDPAHMFPYTPLLMKFAGQAYQAKMKKASIAFYGMVNGDLQTSEDMKAKSDRLGTYTKPINDLSGTVHKQKLKGDLEILQGKSRGGEGIDAIMLAAMAYIQEVNGNTRGAYSAYRQLEELHPKRPDRENQFYNLIRTTSILGDVLQVNEYGQTFLADYPNSEHVDSVRNMMLSSLFAKGEYETCIKVASAVIDKLKEGTEQHDICLHVLGGSKYFLAEFGEAHDLLKKHQDIYGEKSEFALASLYMYGANLAKLQEYKMGAVQLDKFLTKYPKASENPYLPYALFDRANCHYAEEEMSGALDKLGRIEKEFPKVNIADAALNLQGNVHEAEENSEKAEAYYRRAYDQSVTRENDPVSGEAAYYLVSLLGKEEAPAKLKEAVGFYDIYWNKFSEDSPYKAQVAVAGMEAMKALKRGEEGLAKLQMVIAELSRQPGAYGIEEAINSYTEVYLENHTATQLKDHYYNFPDINPDDKATRALLSIAVIGVFEDQLKTALKDKDNAGIAKAQASIKVNFQRLDTHFKVEELSNYILVRLGDYLRKNSSNPRSALKYYEAITGRENPEHRFAAIFGSAEILGESKNPVEQDKAIKLLEDVYTKSEEKAEREDSLYRIVTTMANKGDWAGLETRARDYKLKENRFNKHTPEVSYLLAQSFDKRTMTGDAHLEYMQLRNTFFGYITYSAPATKRIMEIVWKRNDPPKEKGGKSDRQLAYQDGWNYIDATRRLLEKMSDEEKKLWSEVENLVKQYEANSQIMSMADVKKKEAEGR